MYESCKRQAKCWCQNLRVLILFVWFFLAQFQELLSRSGTVPKYSEKDLTKHWKNRILVPPASSKREGQEEQRYVHYDKHCDFDYVSFIHYFFLTQAKRLMNKTTRKFFFLNFCLWCKIFQRIKNFLINNSKKKLK